MNTDNNNDTNKPLVFTDKRTKEKMDLHMSDINDQITEDDIANIITDVTPNTPDTNTTAENEVTANIERMKTAEKGNHHDGNNSNNIGTSWNILDE